jgi:hypothetical protein
MAVTPVLLRFQEKNGASEEQEKEKEWQARLAAAAAMADLRQLDGAMAQRRGLRKGRVGLACAANGCRRQRCRSSVLCRRKKDR